MEGVKNILVEHPIDIPDLNVKGFIDIVVIMETGEVYIYDIKTVGSWSWRFKFGRKKESNPSIHQELQLGTYGYAVKEEFGRCDGLFLMYYNKDTSDVRQGEVGLEFIEQSYNYWTRVQDLHMNGTPSLAEGESPVMAWECKYCQYKEHCDGIN
jgi:hypothetical protein